VFQHPSLHPGLSPALVVLSNSGAKRGLVAPILRKLSVHPLESPLLHLSAISIVFGCAPTRFMFETRLVASLDGVQNAIDRWKSCQDAWIGHMSSSTGQNLRYRSSSGSPLLHGLSHCAFPCVPVSGAPNLSLSLRKCR
jgi:hypothetical protein